MKGLYSELLILMFLSRILYFSKVDPHSSPGAALSDLRLCQVEGDAGTPTLRAELVRHGIQRRQLLRPRNAGQKHCKIFLL